MTHLIDFTGMRAVVTGAASGIGKATAEALAAAGAEVYSLDIAEASTGTFVPMNLLDPDTIHGAIQQVGGPIDVLCNIAGLGAGKTDDNILVANFAGTREVIDAAVPFMSAQSAIVSISTTGGTFWRTRIPELLPLLSTTSYEQAREWSLAHLPEIDNAYVFSKQTLAMYTVLKARQLAPLGIRINTVSPLGIVTPMWQAFADTLSPEEYEAWQPHISGLEGRTGQPSELAAAVLFLGSRAASHITGTDLLVDGGGLSLMAPELAGLELPPMKDSAPAT